MEVEVEVEVEREEGESAVGQVGGEDQDVLRCVLDCLLSHPSAGGEVVGDGRGAAVLALVCRSWRRAPDLLRRLEIRGGAGWKRRLSEDAMTSLGGLVRRSQMLSRLRLDRRSIDARAMTSLVGNAHGAGASLRHLDLRVNCLSNTGVGVLADAMLLGGWGQNVATLDLTHNDLGDEGARHVARMMVAPGSKLTHLYLNDNHLGAAAGGHLGNALATYKGSVGLEVLSLGGNDMGDEGGVSLAEGLSTNSALQELQVAGNRLGDRFALAMAVALGTNHTLSNLNLYCNRIGEDGTRALCAALVGLTVHGQVHTHPNKTLREVNVAHSYATQSNEAKEELRVAVEANRCHWEAATMRAAEAGRNGDRWGTPSSSSWPGEHPSLGCPTASAGRTRTLRDPAASRLYRQIDTSEAMRFAREPHAARRHAGGNDSAHPALERTSSAP